MYNQLIGKLYQTQMVPNETIVKYLCGNHSVIINSTEKRKKEKKRKEKQRKEISGRCC